MKLLILARIGDTAEDIFTIIGVFRDQNVDTAINCAFLKYAKQDDNAILGSPSTRIINDKIYSLWGCVEIHDLQVNKAIDKPIISI